MTRNLFRISSVLMLVLFISACSYNVGYNSAYLAPAGLVGKLDAPLLIVMTKDEEDWVFSGNPTSFTGGGTTLTVPLGNITKQIAIEVFSRHFDPVEMANTLPSGSSYRLVVNPHVTHFEYAYNQLKNLGFAITPEVTVELEVKMFDASGSLLMNKTYRSGKQSGKSYMMSGSPEEKINEALHKALFDLMTNAAEDAVGMTR